MAGEVQYIVFFGECREIYTSSPIIVDRKSFERHCEIVKARDRREMEWRVSRKKSGLPDEGNESSGRTLMRGCLRREGLQEREECSSTKPRRDRFRKKKRHDFARRKSDLLNLLPSSFSSSNLSCLLSSQHDHRTPSREKRSHLYHPLSLFPFTFFQVFYHLHLIHFRVFLSVHTHSIHLPLSSARQVLTRALPASSVSLDPL